MSILNKITALFRTKTTAAVNNALSPEDMHMQAAEEVISKIKELREREVSARKQARQMREKAQEKRNQKDRKDALIRDLRSKNLPVETHARIAILYMNTANAFENKAAELDKMIEVIAVSVAELADRRDDLAARLEYIRVAKEANEMGMNTEEDVQYAMDMMNINIDDMMMRVDTFTDFNTNEVGNATSLEVQEYLNSL